MGNELITVLVIGGLLGFMVLGVPIGVSMALSGFFGIVAIVGLNGTMAVLSDVITETAFSYHLSIIPLFILMGNLASRSGLSRELYQGCAVLFGGVRGGLGMATATVWRRALLPQVGRLAFLSRQASSSFYMAS